MSSSNNHPDYGSTGYWEERYAASDGQAFDWYASYENLQQLIQPFLSKSPDFEVLIPGCGSSTLGPCLYDAGYPNVTNIDISPVVINQMTNKYKDREEMEYTVMDARNLEHLPDSCFNLIIDKAMFDSQLCSEQNVKNISAVTKEMFRVLKPGGVYLVFSYGPPANRVSFLGPKGIDWQVEFRKFPKQQSEGSHVLQGTSEHHYMYICRKANTAQRAA